MGLLEVVEVAVVAPRHRSEELARDLMDFEDFHPAEKQRFRDPQLHEIEYKAELGYAAVQSLIQELGVKESAGILEQLARPIQIQQATYSAQDLFTLLEKLDLESKPLVSKANEYIEERRRLEEKINQLRGLYSSFKAFKDLKIDFENINKLWHFHVFLGISSGPEIAELKKTLTKSAVFTFSAEGMFVVLIVSKKTDADEVERVVKALGIKPLMIPPGYGGVLSETVAVLESEIREISQRLQKISEELHEFLTKHGPLLVSIRDGYLMVKENLARIAGAGKLRYFAVAEGYVPGEKIDEFRARMSSKYLVVVGNSHHKHGEDKPTILRNSSLAKPFESITLIQGHPRSGEIDPTAIVSVFFTVFYGLMFADIGHGLVILGFALFMYRRVSGPLKDWAKLLAFLGISSAVMGFLVGEAFGFKVGKMIYSPELIHLVEEHGGAKQFSLAEVQKFLVFTILLGVVHMTVGYVFSIVKFLKEGEKAEALTVKAPTLAMYLFGILFVLAFFGAGGNMQAIFTTATPAPLVNLPTSFVGTVGIYGAVACIVVLLFGRYVAGLAGIGHRIGLVSSIGSGLLEVLENIIHFLSNTISYARITILLIVHIALLLLLNTAWESVGIASLPLLIVGNAGIIVLEGLLVFIQAMRLHVYEFFSKFYDGTGTPFKKLLKQSQHTRLEFKG